MIGGLFRSETRKRTKTNLMVFLRPVVVRSPDALSNLTESRYDYIRNVYGSYPAPKRWLMPDNSPGKLPDLKIDSVLTVRPEMGTTEKAADKPAETKVAPAEEQEPAFWAF